MHGTFGRNIIEYTVIYGVYVRFWPTLVNCHAGNRRMKCPRSDLDLFVSSVPSTSVCSFIAKCAVCMQSLCRLVMCGVCLRSRFSVRLCFGVALHSCLFIDCVVCSCVRLRTTWPLLGRMGQHTGTQTHTHTHSHTHTHTLTHAHAHTHTLTHTHTHTHTQTNKHTHTHTHIHAHTYTHTKTQDRKSVV